MARITMVAEDQASGVVDSVYKEIRNTMGMVPNVIKILSLWPEVMELYAKRFQLIVFSETRLKRSTKEMIASVVSKTNSCDYCLGHHKNFMVQYGVSPSVAEHIVNDPAAAEIPEAERKLLAYAEKVTRNAYKVTDAEVEDLKRAGWTDEQILEATLVASLFNDVNRFVDALGVTPEAASREKDPAA